MDENDKKLLIFVEVKSSWRQVKGKPGHVAEIHVCSAEQRSKSLYLTIILWNRGE